MGVYNGAGKCTGGRHVTLHKFAPKSNQATDWPHLNFNVINIFYCNFGRKNGRKICSRCGATDFLSFPPVSLVV